MTDRPTVTTIATGVARVSWPRSLQEQGFTEAVAQISEVVGQALAEHGRVEALVAPDDADGQRIATWSGLLREGVMRGGHVEDGVHADRIVYARVVGDQPVSDPMGFRSLLNSFLPRKRAISQMLIRDPDDRVLMCRLTYKQDWDLPGGVVEVGESPRAAVSREVAGGTRALCRGGTAASDRLAACLGRLGRRGLPRLRRRRARCRRRRDDRP